MRVLITGSTGFIGARLAARCRELGHDVVATGQLNTPLEEFRHRRLQDIGIGVRQMTLSDREGLYDIVQRCDVVFHLAAAQHETNVPDRYFREINVDGTRNVLDASREAHVKRLVLGSTIGVYGAALSGEIDENTPTRPDNIYEVSKLESEELALEYQDAMEISIIRISETYGPGDGRLLKLFKALKKGTFFVIGKGENIHQLIYVDDLVAGLLAAARRPEAVGQELVVAGTERLTTAEMCGQIAEAVGKPLRAWKAPMWPFALAALGFETVCPPLGIQPPLHGRRLDFFRKSFYFSTQKSREALAFEPPTSFRDGVIATAEWYAAEGFL